MALLKLKNIRHMSLWTNMNKFNDFTKTLAELHLAIYIKDLQLNS